jgi:hypothetical protein
MSKGQVLSYSLILTHSNDDPIEFFPVSIKPREWLPSPNLFARGGLGEWLAGSSLIVLPCQCAGRDGGQGIALTNDNLSYLTSQAHWSQDFASTMITAILNSSQFGFNGQSPHPFSLFPLSRGWPYHHASPGSLGWLGCRHSWAQDC